MIKRLNNGKFRIYSRTKPRRNLGTFKTREAAEKHEREIEHFKHTEDHK